MADSSSSCLLARLGEVRRIAVLKASRIGDFVCATPAFRALRKAFPRASITLITLPMLVEIAQRLGYFDRILEFPGYPGLAEQFFDARRALVFFQKMQAESFDFALQMQGSGVYANPFLLMLGARASAGFVRPGDTPGRLDAAVPFAPLEHEIERMLALPRSLGLPTDGVHTDFPLRSADRLQAQTLLGDGLPRPWIGLHPGARARTRRWPAACFSKVACRLARDGGASFVILGDGETQESAAELAAGIEGNCVNLAGCTSLPVLGAVIAELSLLVTSDSGPAHIAYPLGTSTITVFRRGASLRYGPPRAPRFIGLEPAPGRRLVDASQVIEAAARLLAARADRARAL
ncbi:MAG TPA: glycosyltransferase family 9 protein [Gammaproteobacteria bacterium]|nr:glycosyltransferase family 9 protein [Gammaproteobacteria bacterium]